MGIGVGGSSLVMPFDAYKWQWIQLLSVLVLPPPIPMQVQGR